MNWLKAFERVLRVLRQQQMGMAELYETGRVPYSFGRNTDEPSDTLSHRRGWPYKQCGLIATPFR